MIRIVVIVLVALAGVAQAQPAFPDNPFWAPFPCGGTVATDPLGDDPEFLDELDVVGDRRAAAARHASDDDFLYLRLRLEDDPADAAGVLSPFSWGFELDLDGDLTTYEVLVLVDGVLGTVELFSNTATTIPNSPADPADALPISYLFDDAARTITADTGTPLGDSDDFFLDIAVPWVDLATVGIARTTRVSIWAGSSDLADGLNGDLACAAGGPAVLDVIAGDETVGDSTIDSDGDGFTDAEEVEGGSDPNDANSIPEIRLEGGGGCDAGGGALISAIALGGLRRKRRTPRSA
ncbi:MAG: thrombospondin type 3 repeat-containing protein [Kofleriaceae bacterium]